MMPYRLMADLVVALHLAIVGFVVFGGVFVVFYRRVAWLHLPIVAWVVFAELFQRICPLTYLENWLRDRGAIDTYRGDFVAHYLMPVLYPEGLTPRIQIVFGALVLLINASLYAFAFGRQRFIHRFHRLRTLGESKSA
jgi:hypothetical protein